MDTNDYITEAHNQILSDTYYKPLEGPVYLNTTDEVNSILDKLLLNEWPDNKQVEYLKTCWKSQTTYILYFAKNSQIGG